MIRNKLGWAAIAGLLLVGTLSAQGLGWSGASRLYVDPVLGSDVPTGGSVASPLRTISFAIANFAAGASINLRAGLYSSATNGESFPIALPLMGFKIEAYEPGVVIDAGGATAIQLNGGLVSPAGLPFSVLRGLEITGGSIGVQVLASAIPAGQTAVRCEIKQCNIRDNEFGFPNGVGIAVVTNPNVRTELVIEDNEIQDQAVGMGGTGSGIGIRFQVGGFGANFGVDTSLVRSNRIHDQQIGISMAQLENAGICRPRIFSNHFYTHQNHVASANCGPIMVNNSMAFSTAAGILHTITGVSGPQNETVTPTQLNPFATLAIVRNSILWNPAAGAPEISGNGPFASSFNDLQDAGTATNVTTRGGNVIIGAAPAFVSAVAPIDLHLTVAATQIETAETALLLPGTTVAVGGVAVPADVSVDVDGDCRLLDFVKPLNANEFPLVVPDRGGDEVLSPAANPVGGCRLATGSVFPADPFGNVNFSYFGGGGGVVDLQVFARPGDIVLLFGYLDDPSNPDMNFVNATNVFGFNLTWGNMLLPANPGLASIASGFANASGVFVGPTFSIAPVPGIFEAEFWYQAVCLEGAGFNFSGDLTNRLRLQINE